MKNLFILLFCILFTNIASSQNFIEKNFSKHLENENTTRVQLSQKMFQMIATMTSEMTDEDAKKAHDIAAKITSFDLIVLSDLANPQAEFTNAMAKLKNYDQLVRVKEKNTNVSIVVDGDDDVIREIVGIVAEENEFIVFTLNGEIDIKEIGQLTETLQSDAFKGMAKNHNLGGKDTKVFPNPVKKGSNVVVDIQEDLVGASITVIDAAGKVFCTVVSKERSNDIDTSNLLPGSYSIRIEKGATIITKKLIILE